MIASNEDTFPSDVSSWAQPALGKMPQTRPASQLAFSMAVELTQGGFAVRGLPLSPSLLLSVSRCLVAESQKSFV